MWSLSLMYSHQDPKYAFPTPIRTTCPTHLILLDFITRTILGEEYRSLSSSLCSFLHSPLTSFLLGRNIFFSTLFSNTLRFPSSLNVSYQVSHPYKTTGRIKSQHNFLYYEIESRLYCLIECRLRFLIKKDVLKVIAILHIHSVDTTACHA